MPTRVLEICEDYANPSVRLIGSEGQTGRFIALSHCWGSTGKQPLRTTSKNLNSHQNMIQFQDLPKTFQDCVEFSQGMGIKYVWIDSLCIIQDDHQDWLSESARMRNVYQNATVVVAASGSKDSTEGLFITNRPRAKVFRLPYRVNSDIQGTFNMMQLSGQWDPRWGSLERRAWTLQERSLARRFLAFMPYGITWICKGSSIDEAGRDFDGFNPRIDWYSLLHTYTTRSLTVPSDRPEAIRGIAEEIQRSRKDRYLPEYGVWEEELGRQLLWLTDGPQFDEGRLPNVPTWSWMATKDAKKWSDDQYSGDHGDFQRSEEMTERFLVTLEGYLHLSGHLTTKPLATNYVRQSSTVRELDVLELRELHDPFCRRNPKLSRDFHVITQDMHDACHQEVLGIVRFDHVSKASYTHMWFIAKQRRKKAEDRRSTMLAKAAEEAGLGEEWEEVSNGDERQGSDLDEEEDFNSDFASLEQDDLEDFVVWAIKRLGISPVQDAPFAEEQTIVRNNRLDSRAETNIC